MKKLLNVNINGNKKLINNDKVRFMIWNLPAQKTCPFATEHCKAACYAKKAERVYPQVLPSREKNYHDSLQADFVENMIYTIEHHLNSKAFKGKKALFRIHESGDFYSLEYTKKWVAICKHFEHDNRIEFLTYTKSIPYFIQAYYGIPGFPNNLIVRSSIWDDTDQNLIALTQFHGFPIYTALSKQDIETEKKDGHSFFQCSCVDCGKCQACYCNKVKDIICEIH